KGAVTKPVGVSGRWQADLTVTMIHVKITGLLNLQAADIIVGKAVAHVDFPATLVCGPQINRDVSGFADIARFTVGPGIYPEYATQGYVQLPPTGGTESQHIVALNAGLLNHTLVAATTADTYTTGTIQTNQVY